MLTGGTDHSFSSPFVGFSCKNSTLTAKNHEMKPMFHYFVNKASITTNVGAEKKEEKNWLRGSKDNPIFICTFVFKLPFASGSSL